MAERRERACGSVVRIAHRSNNESETAKWRLNHENQCLILGNMA